MNQEAPLLVAGRKSRLSHSFFGGILRMACGRTHNMGFRFGVAPGHMFVMAFKLGTASQSDYGFHLLLGFGSHSLNGVQAIHGFAVPPSFSAYLTVP